MGWMEIDSIFNRTRFKEPDQRENIYELRLGKIESCGVLEKREPYRYSGNQEKMMIKIEKYIKSHIGKEFCRKDTIKEDVSNTMLNSCFYAVKIKLEEEGYTFKRKANGLSQLYTVIKKERTDDNVERID